MSSSSLQRSLDAAPIDHELTVLIPAFNEAQRLPGTLAGLAEFFRGWAIDYRVVVLDDGSQDGTAAISDRFGPRFSTIRLGRQQGKGAAVRRGMLAATGRIVAFTDADLPYDMTALEIACDWIRQGGCEAVFGARDLLESKHEARRRLSRIVASAVFRQVVKRVVSREVTDTQCGLKVFSRRAALEIFSRTSIDGFAFDAEVVLLCHRLKLPLRRVPVTLINEYASTLSLSRHAGKMLRDVLRLGLRDWLSGRQAPPVRTLPEFAKPGKQLPGRAA
ncbi:MAG TPA: glycosyltransferase [Pirellulales bacterium]|jgi:dolichyl-phosphate beta-glucosyltransferase|nr:glycosyltransferase [Pirellulales bacterium]